MAGRPNSKGREVVDPFARDERFIPPQAPIELIKRRNNDGSRLIRAFNYGDIPFFDTFGPYQVADNLVGPTDIKNPPNGYCADRRATFHNFLLNEAHNHTLSIIIPYEGVTEKWYELSEHFPSGGLFTWLGIGGEARHGER